MTKKTKILLGLLTLVVVGGGLTFAITQNNQSKQLKGALPTIGNPVEKLQPEPTTDKTTETSKGTTLPTIQDSKFPTNGPTDTTPTTTPNVSTTINTDTRTPSSAVITPLLAVKTKGSGSTQIGWQNQNKQYTLGSWELTASQNVQITGLTFYIDSEANMFDDYFMKANLTSKSNSNTLTKAVGPNSTFKLVAGEPTVFSLSAVAKTSAESAFKQNGLNMKKVMLHVSKITASDGTTKSGKTLTDGGIAIEGQPVTATNPITTVDVNKPAPNTVTTTNPITTVNVNKPAPNTVTQTPSDGVVQNPSLTIEGKGSGEVKVDWNNTSQEYKLGKWRLTATKDMEITGLQFSLGSQKLSVNQVTEQTIFASQNTLLNKYFTTFKLDLNNATQVQTTTNQALGSLVTENSVFKLKANVPATFVLTARPRPSMGKTFADNNLEGKKVFMLVPEMTVQNQKLTLSTDTSKFQVINDGSTTLSSDKVTSGGISVLSKINTLITPKPTNTTTSDTSSTTATIDSGSAVEGALAGNKKPNTSKNPDTGSTTASTTTTPDTGSTSSNTSNTTTTSSTTNITNTNYYYSDGSATDTPIDPNAGEKLSSPEYSCSSIFTDLYGHWAEDDVCRLFDAKVVSGRTPTSYVPNADTTRAEFLKVVLRIQGYTNTDADGLYEPFQDVNAGDWFQSYVALGYNKGLIKGDGTNFRPNDSITRGDAALILMRATGENQTTQNNRFTDVGTQYYAPAVVTASNTLVDTANGTDIAVLNGYPDGTFRPEDPIARSELAALILRAALAWFL